MPLALYTTRPYQAGKQEAGSNRRGGRFELLERRPIELATLDPTKKVLGVPVLCARRRKNGSSSLSLEFDELTWAQPQAARPDLALF